MSPSATPTGTSTRYQDVYDRLDAFAISADLHGSPDESPYGRVVDALLAERIEWTPATERSKKTAVLHVLDAAILQGIIPAYYAKRRLLGMLVPHVDELGHFCSHEEKDAAIARELKFQRQRTMQLEERAQRTPRAQAARHLVLCQALEGSRSKWAADTLRWYQAASLTGIAPRRWRGATWVNCGRGRFGLCLSDRASADRIGAFVALNELTTDQLSIIRAHVETVDAKVRAGEFDAWYDACRTLLRMEASGHWMGQENLPTLHPVRHLFAEVDG
ncbi:hypothetical protein WKW79_15245 [Variovorax robiniae]|uniref:Uncharacterized protein n=1 Tax=Variovorax robiniae TaxID=1836199 RepID=A0ABU8X9Y7_9BURK